LRSSELGVRVRASVFILSLAVLATVVLSLTTAPAGAQVVRTESLPGGVQRTTYRLGPVTVDPGQNRIAFRPITGASRPGVNGWITRIKPDLVYEDGTIPESSKVMFHHGVWINNANGNLFYATGEEKTILQLPQGFGYRYNKNDPWTLNDMIHNLTSQGMKLYFEYTLDFIPNSAPEAESIVPAHPIWMDVQSGIYPVFDVWRDSGGPDGEITYPEDVPNAYPPGVYKNVQMITQPGMLIATTGHVHTGGLSTNLYLRREGATYQGPTCPDRVSYDAQLDPLQKKHAGFVTKIKKLKSRNKKMTRNKKKIVRTLKKRKNKAKAKRQIRKIKRRKAKNSRTIAKTNRKKIANKKELDRVSALDREERERDAACRATQPQIDKGNRVHLFNSKAHYFDPRGPISWDMAMYSTDENWRVRVQTGDRIELQTTYDTKIASWPESMGINIVYWVRDKDLPAAANAPNPYETRVDTEGVLNHGHLAENEDYGGELPTVGPDPRDLPDGALSSGPSTITDYIYNGSTLSAPAIVKQGDQFTFKLSQADINKEVWHSITSCKAPCNRSTGISYPIPDGDVQFESGQMGPGQQPTVGYTQWSTPKDLPKGTYTFFCRIHPFMRGAFRVK